MSASKAPGAVMVLKVSLMNDGEPVWRRIAIRTDQTLDDLHACIFKAFDRFDSHLYFFQFPKPQRGFNWNKRWDPPRYAHPYDCEPSPITDELPRNAAKTTLQSLALVARRKFYYCFDYGDEWWHCIEVESVNAALERGGYPRILERHGDSPPQYPECDEDEGGEIEIEFVVKEPMKTFAIMRRKGK
jgi:hypothetical protein